MLTTIDDLLAPDELEHFRTRLNGADWIDGRATASGQALSAKHNEQLDVDSAVAIQLGQALLTRLARHPRFLSAALPEKILPPRFSRYRNGGRYDTHIDAAILRFGPSAQTLRSDLAATVFLSDPDEYDGGELSIETEFAAQQVKLPAGSMVLYPAGSLHRVKPVTRGARLCAVFWVQSLLRDPIQRALLYDLDQTIQSLSGDLDHQDPRLTALAGTYHNLLRQWASAG